MTPESLIAAVVAMSFHLPADHARIHVEAAVAAARTYHDQLQLDEDQAVNLFLGIAYIESNYDELSLSRIECHDLSCKRVTGHLPASEVVPPTAAPSWFCGPMQTGGRVPWADCERMREDVAYGYATGAQELIGWFNYQTCANLPHTDRLTCALAGYNGGLAGADRWHHHKYPGNVLWAAGRIQQFAEFAEKKAALPAI